jgi:hypothetical protein
MLNSLVCRMGHSRILSRAVISWHNGLRYQRDRK